MTIHGTTAETCTPGQQAEIASRLVRAIPKALKYSELTPSDILKYTSRSEPLERALAAALWMLYNGHADVVVPDWSIEPYAPAGVTIESHTDCGSWRWDVDKLGLWRAPRDKIMHVETAIKDAAGLTFLNAKHAEHLTLHEHDVPADWQDKYVIFPGTILVSPKGERFVIGVYCYGRKRSSFPLSLNSKWHPDWVIATLKQEQE